MEVYMKDKLKMDSGMAMGSIKLMMLLMKDSGNKVRNKARGKLYSKVGVYFKVILKTI